MMRYDYIDHVLANYFAVDIGYSEQEAIDVLRQDMAASPELAVGLRRDAQNALLDDSFSWLEAFAKYDVVTIDGESEARQYARELLGAVLDLPAE
jgi:hypothetical protein